MGKGSLRGSGRAGCAVQGAVIPYSHFPTVPVCWSMALWAPRLKSILPLAICWSRGTSTDVSQDRDCKSPGSSSSLSWDGSEARSLQSSRAGYQGAGMGLQHPWEEMAWDAKAPAAQWEKSRLEFCIQIQMCPSISQLVTDTPLPALVFLCPV